ncbi:MAG: OsmC family protein [Cyclobacteriaceae bacterium]
MDLTVDLHYKADEEYYTENASGNKVDIDMLARDDKKAQSPMELLLSAVMACAAVDIVSMVKKRRKKFIDIKGKASGKRREKPPKSFTDIHIHYDIASPDLTEEEAERIVGLATTKYCSVAGTINESAKITHGFSIVRE